MSYSLQLYMKIKEIYIIETNYESRFLSGDWKLWKELSYKSLFLPIKK